MSAQFIPNYQQDIFTIQERKQQIIQRTSMTEKDPLLKFRIFQLSQPLQHTIDRDFLSISANIMKKVWGSELDNEWDNT